MTDSHRKSARNKAEGSKHRSHGKQQSVAERTAQAAEKVHRAVAGFPLDLLERVDRLQRPVARVRKLQDRSITATYDMLRGIGREVTGLAREARRESPKPRKPQTVHHKPAARAAHAPATG
jgi:hypothetical protein